MIKVALFGVWWKDIESPINKYLPLTPSQSGIYGEIMCVNNIEDADYYIVQQSDSNLSENLSRKKKIYFQREPFEVDSKSLKTNRGIYKSTYQNGYHYAAWWLDKTYDELKSLPFVKKGKKCSAIISHKQETIGQKRRLEFSKYAYKHEVSIDFFGSINQVLGKIQKKEKINLFKFDLIYPYNYSLIPENGRVQNYFTEKLIDAYLGWSMPIYDGCPNIDKYFPKESYHTVNLDHKEESLYQINKIIKEPLTKIQIEAIAHARELILDKYNFWACLEDIILNQIPQTPWYKKMLFQYTSLN
jgi:hypothetical protein